MRKRRGYVSALVVLDEPSSNLDFEAIAQLRMHFALEGRGDRRTRGRASDPLP